MKLTDAFLWSIKATGKVQKHLGGGGGSIYNVSLQRNPG